MYRGLCLLLLALSAAARADSDSPFLWQVVGPHATHYLLGSVHLLPDASNDLPQGIDEAYDAVDGLVFETDIGAIEQRQVQMALVEAARSDNGLKAEVGDKLYERVVREEQHLGMPADACNDFKAWFCAMSLEVFAYRKAGFIGDNGVDLQLYRWAREDAKTISWFEQPGAHLGLFTSMPPAVAREFLASAVDDSGMPGGDDDPAAMLRAWQDDDTGAIETLVGAFKSRFPEVYERLLAGRNRSWMPQLKRILDGASPQMVVVGAAHWLGPDGLIPQLKSHGYRVLPYAATGQQLLTGAPPALVQTALRR